MSFTCAIPLCRACQGVYDRQLSGVEQRLFGYIDDATVYVGSGLKHSLKDAAMPDVLKDLIDETVDKMVPEVKSTAASFTSQV